MELIIIFDTNGFIGGMHSVVPKKLTAPEFDFAASKWYRSDNILGEEVWLTTAYFVEPSSICGSGRTQSDFDNEGTGNRLIFQKGPNFQDVLVAPLTVDDADADVSPIVSFFFLDFLHLKAMHRTVV